MDQDIHKLKVNPIKTYPILSCEGCALILNVNRGNKKTEILRRNIRSLHKNIDEFFNDGKLMNLTFIL